MNARRLQRRVAAATLLAACLFVSEAPFTLGSSPSPSPTVAEPTLSLQECEDLLDSGARSAEELRLALKPSPTPTPSPSPEDSMEPSASASASPSPTDSTDASPGEIPEPTRNPTVGTAPSPSVESSPGKPAVTGSPTVTETPAQEAPGPDPQPAGESEIATIPEESEQPATSSAETITSAFTVVSASTGRKGLASLDAADDSTIGNEVISVEDCVDLGAARMEAHTPPCAWFVSGLDQNVNLIPRDPRQDYVGDPLALSAAGRPIEIRAGAVTGSDEAECTWDSDESAAPTPGLTLSVNASQASFQALVPSADNIADESMSFSLSGGQQRLELAVTNQDCSPGFSVTSSITITEGALNHLLASIDGGRTTPTSRCTLTIAYQTVVPGERVPSFAGAVYAFRGPTLTFAQNST